MHRQARGFVSLILLALVLSFCCAANATPLITSFKVYSQPQSWRLVFGLSASIKYRIFSLKNPNRLVIDFYGVRHHSSFSLWEYSKAPIKNMRVGLKKDRTRLVIDLATALKVKAHLRYVTHRKTQLLVDLLRDRPFQSPNNQTVSKLRHSSSSGSHSHPSLIRLPPVNRAKKIIVVIDPGHGGKDPGATGPMGYREKNVVLAISKKLYRLINHEPGFKAYLTRRGDYYLTLRRRLAIARRYKADMFIAIHADAFRDNSARGASVFALSQRGATSEAARWLAAKENSSELMGGVDLADKSHMLQSVLISLSQNASVRISLQIGSDIIRALSQFAALHHHKVEQAAFVVLKSPDIPSLLVETGFISNSYEERRLISPRYQQRLALAMENGIVKYFSLHPPRGSSLAKMKEHRSQSKTRYVVGKGDVLQRVAELYGVSPRSIMRLNRLSSGRLLVGQTLLIPKS